MPSWNWTNWIGFPALPHIMQWNSPLAGETIKLGVCRSSWNGQRPMKSFVPCFFKLMPRLCTSATRSVSRLTRSISASGMRQGISVSIIGDPLAGFLVVLAPVAVGVEQPLPATLGHFGRTEREPDHAPSLVVPAAERFEAVVPIVLIRLAHDQPAQAREFLRQARRQRVLFPIVPGIMTEGALHHFRVEHAERARELLHRALEAGAQNRLFPGERQAGYLKF